MKLNRMENEIKLNEISNTDARKSKKMNVFNPH